MNGRWSPYTASQPCAEGGTFRGHGDTPEAAFGDLHSFVTGRSKYAGHPTGEPTCVGPGGETYSKARAEAPSEGELGERLRSLRNIVYVRLWDVPAREGKPARFFAEVITRADP